MSKTNRYFLIFFISFLNAQDVDSYLSLIYDENAKGVSQNLPELLSKYPKDSGVLFLKALLTEDGESAFEQYKKIIKNYPESKYAPLSAMKIGEYFYAKGLYTQSANILKKIPASYPRFKDMQRLTDLMINSFNAIGQVDSARYYGLLVESMFPQVETNLLKNEDKLNQVFDFKKKTKSGGPYVVQVGAFSSKENAKRLKLQLSQLGHDVSINNVESNGKTFYAVRINRFKSKSKAEQIGKGVKSKLGVNYRVLYRPS